MRWVWAQIDLLDLKDVVLWILAEVKRVGAWDFVLLFDSLLLLQSLQLPEILDVFDIEADAVCVRRAERCDNRNNLHPGFLSMLDEVGGKTWSERRRLKSVGFQCWRWWIDE